MLKTPPKPHEPIGKRKKPAVEIDKEELARQLDEVAHGVGNKDD